LGTEIELKLNINRKDATHLRSHPAIVSACVGKPVTQELMSIYYDTPDLKLLDVGVSLRTRHISGSWVQTLKASGSSIAGLHKRKEWEQVITSSHPDFSKIDDPFLIKLFANKKLRNALIPIFQTEVRRKVWQLDFENGDNIELALDLGQLVVGESRESISELELELKHGHAGRLFDLALELQKAIPMRLENLSKGQRGYMYYRPVLPSVFKVKQLKLTRDVDAQSAFKQIAWECIHHLQNNQDVVLHGADVEGVHQMRVAIRRLRCVFVLFRRIFGRASSAALLAELSWLGDVLGKARDLDVFITQTLPAVMAQFEHHIGLQQLQDKALTAQAEVYTNLRVVLPSQRYHTLLLRLADWLENERWQEGLHDVRRFKLGSIAKAALTKYHKQLRKSGANLLILSPEERHTTRIAAKKLRYAAEFFASLYASTKSQSFVRNLTQLQERLGLLNDMTITEKLLHQLIGQSTQIELNETLHIFAGWNACNAVHGVKSMDKAWRKFMSQKAFWQ
jgi:inorganic triphosphatase YgiF